MLSQYENERSRSEAPHGQRCLFWDLLFGLGYIEIRIGVQKEQTNIIVNNALCWFGGYEHDAFCWSPFSGGSYYFFL